MVLIAALVSQQSIALQPPTVNELEQYRKEGTLDTRIAAARNRAKTQLSPKLLMRSQGATMPLASSLSYLDEQVMPSVGTVKALALLIDFSDAPHENSQAAIDGALFGTGPGIYPKESLSRYYYRSSYGKLDIRGNTLGWYRSATPRVQIRQDYVGRQRLIRQALDHYNALGHDFSQYDNDHDGVIDYFIVIWAGEKTSWASFWWAYQTEYTDSSYRVDGKRLRIYSWQWETYLSGKPFSPTVVIHETGHALGLPDLYDLNPSVGPGGGVGGLDIMAQNWGDHNAYHKWLLGWISATVVSASSRKTHQLNPVSETASNNMVVVPTGNSNPTNPLKEMFVIENRWQSQNDLYIPNNGLLIWHIDGTQLSSSWKYNNTDTARKYIRLMEADGKEEIQSYLAFADEEDFFTEGRRFTPYTSPSSDKYDGSSSSIWVTNIRRNTANHTISFKLADTQPISVSQAISIAPMLMLLLD